MKKTVGFAIDENVVRRFDIALELAGLSQREGDAYIEQCMADYARKVFAKEANGSAAQAFFAPTGTNAFMTAYVQPNISDNGQNVDQDALRMRKKIEKWAHNPNCVPHIIIKAYLRLEKSLDKGDGTNYGVTKYDLALAVRELSGSDTLFRTNYPQMKRAISVSPHSHGLVFDEDRGVVTLNQGVREQIHKLAEYFLQ